MVNALHGKFDRCIIAVATKRIECLNFVGGILPVNLEALRYINRFPLYRRRNVREGKRWPGIIDLRAFSSREDSHFRKLLLAVHPHFATLMGRVAGTRKKKQPADGFC